MIINLQIDKHPDEATIEAGYQELKALGFERTSIFQCGGTEYGIIMYSRTLFVRRKYFADTGEYVGQQIIRYGIHGTREKGFAVADVKFFDANNKEVNVYLTWKELEAIRKAYVPIEE